MDLREFVEKLGGVCTSRELRRMASWRSIAAALESHQLVRIGHGTYALPGADRDQFVATRFHATLAVLSAAQAHGWKVLNQPDKPWLSIPRGRPISPQLRRSAHLVRSGSGTVTDPLTTALDCLRHLPMRESVSAVDSALRSGAVTTEELEIAVLKARGPGSSRMREALPHLSPLAANPFESCLGLIAHEFGGFERQVPIELPGFTVHPDLVNRELGIVLEGDSWEFHASTPELFARDCERYTLLTVNRWLVLRFTYWQVVHNPEWVRSVIEQAVALRSCRTSDNGWRHAGDSAA